jgi:hypothetical protein
MKKIIFLIVFNTAMIISLQSQSVTNYICKLDNGITVRTEQCWNHVWASQSNEALKAGDPSVSLSVRTLGDLTSSSAFKLFSAGKEVKVQGAKEGTYTMKVTFKLTGKPGSISFDVENVIVKPGSKTTVSVILYDYQISIDETTGTQGGLASFTSKIDRYKGNTEQNPSCGIPSFYAAGKHDTPLQPAELKGKAGKIKPGTYDVLITLGAPGKVQKIWLENFIMKPDVSYNISTNLNAGVVEYSGVNREVKSIQMYPAGTADKQKPGAAPDKNLELVRCEGVATTTPCPPGTYDVLLNAGTKSEWRKGIVVKTGSRTQVK